LETLLKGRYQKLGKIPRRATRMIEGCSELKYSERLAATGLTSLENRRTRGDLIEVFKMIKGISKLEYRNYFRLEENSRTRGHKCKIVKERSRLDLRKNFFSQRIVSEWNKLPTSVVGAESANSFKNRYDSYIRLERK
jgi:ribonuclease P/MRP protein subunit RPP40